ncbi:MAG: trehalose-phosphatase [Rhodocyclales bacterium]|nr:trehalose-phosphatase [Rhodocyclales bacterium]
MPVLGREASPTGLPGRPATHAFFLDIDGTLLDIAERPERVATDPWLLEAVRALHVAAGGALALISGRTVAGVDRLFAPLRLAVAGQHGAERRDAAGAWHYHGECAAQLEALRRCVTAWAAARPGLLVEDKGLSLAVHYRAAPQLADEVHHGLRECLERTGEGFRLQPGKMVLELKPAGRDKGVAIREFMDEPPFAGRVPVFVGDDATDEHGFAVVNDLGGCSVKVGPGPSAAGWRLPDVAAVRAWLETVS